MRALALLTLLALAACGVDGAPSTPGGVSVSGTATIGVSGEVQ